VFSVGGCQSRVTVAVVLALLELLELDEEELEDEELEELEDEELDDDVEVGAVPDPDAEVELGR
jgi:hypothetical protein